MLLAILEKLQRQVKRKKKMYAIVENNQIIEWPIVNLLQRFPQVSFANPINDNALPEGVVKVGISTFPQHNPLVQKPLLGNPELIDGQWIQQYSVENLTNIETQERNDQQSNIVRSERNQKLSESDWTQLADAPVDKQVWSTYRQALRDVTTQSGFPWDITWPVQP